MNAEQQRLHDAMAQRLTDEGKLIEVGWQAMCMFVIPANAPAVQVSEMRKAFFLGAQHVFASMMAMLEPGDDATELDFKRMDAIHNELEAFRMEVASAHRPGRS